jgi:putative SOS response-associated peptidase YedK
MKLYTYYRSQASFPPYPAEEMTCWPVNTRVGNVKNNDPSLVESITGGA